MREPRDDLLRFATASAVIVAVAVGGCAEELGVDRPATARVAGVVLDGGRPVAGGWIEFIPVEGTVGSMRSAPIGPDGRFEVDHAPIGAVGVGLAAVRTVTTDPRPFDSLRTSIRRTIPPGGGSALTIDLVEEAIRYRAMAAALRGG